MSALAVLDALLLAATVATGAVAVFAPRRTAATATFLVFGVLLALLWARLGAADVALAEAALGGGVAGALLVDALGRRRPPRPAPGTATARGARAIAGAAAGAVALVALAIIARAVSPLPSPLATEALGTIPETGVSHPITAVLLNYRSLDTLLEIAVLVTAAWGAAAVARPARSAAPAEASVDPLRRALAGVLLPVLVVLAAWLLVAGSSQPGGAFQSGALLAAALVIADLCGYRRLVPRGRTTAWLVAAGLIAFVALAAVGLALEGAWLAMDPAWAGSAILAVEAVLAVTIGVALFAIFDAAGRADARTPEPSGAAS